MAKQQLDKVTIEDARIIFRNFAGAEGQYNRAGDRNFAVVLPPDVAQAMLNDGWNIKFLKPREEGEDPTPYVSVSVSYKGRPPRIVLVTSRGRTTLPEELVEMVDYVDIAKVDLILNPYVWNVNGNSGVKAYLQSMFVTVMEDELERKYADVPEIDVNGKPLEIADHSHGQSPDDIIDAEVIEDEEFRQIER